MSENPLADPLVNPKDLVGRAKIDLSLFPPAGFIHGAHAFMDGARKYGPYNWREKRVSARVYLSAAMRHLNDFLDGEDRALDSEVNHLGHAIACCAIILDAFETGNLIDDRPVKGVAASLLEALNAIEARRAAERADAAFPQAGGTYPHEVAPSPSRVARAVAAKPRVCLKSADGFCARMCPSGQFCDLATPEEVGALREAAQRGGDFS